MSAGRVSPLATPEPWSLVAAGYVAENLRSFDAFAREALTLAPAEGDVVDVAAGPGSLTLQAARTARAVHAVDFARGMLRELRARLAASGHTNVTVALGDGQALPIADGRLDAAYSMFGLIFFPDRARGLREMARVLRPGGSAVVSAWVSSDRIPAFAALFGAMKAEMPNAGIGEAPAALGTVDEMRDALSAAGFAHVEVHERTVIPGTVTPDELWNTFSRGGAPAVLMRKRMGEEAFAALSERIVRRLHEALGPEPRELAMTALLGVGRR